MTRTLLVLSIVLFSTLLFAQTDTITIDWCQKAAKQNFPLLKQKGIVQNIVNLKRQNLSSNHLPQLNLNGIGSWQSEAINMGDVFGDNHPLTSAIDFPSPLYFQYRLTMEINQTLYDGGRTKHAKAILLEQMKADTLKIETQLQTTKETVDQTFFTILLLKKQLEILTVLENDLTNRLESVKSAVLNGVLLESDQLAIEAEIIQTQQNQMEIKSGIESATSVLTILCHQPINTDAFFKKPNISIDTKSEFKRTENLLFSKQMENVLLNKKLIKANRRPTVGCLAQAGYGLPGLNPLNDSPSEIIFIGIKASWNIWDWNNAKREKQALLLQKDYIEKNQFAFNDKLNIELTKELDKIDNYTKQLKKDEKILEIRKKIVTMAKSQLDNGVITATEYLTEVNLESKAKLQLESHTILLIQAEANANTILGN